MNKITRTLATLALISAAGIASAAPSSAPATPPAASAPASAFGSKAATTPAPMTLVMNGITTPITDAALSEFSPASKSQLKTPWYDTPQDFSGVSFKAILETYKVPKTAALKITAHDGYTIELPASDAWQHDVLLATHMGGKRLTLRDKGPYFLIYPLNQPGMNLPQFFARCIWSIKTIQVL